MKITRRDWALAAGAMAACGANPEPESTEAPGDDAYVLDLHCDTPMRLVEEGFDLASDTGLGQLDIPRMRAGGVTGVFFSIYCAGQRGPTPEKAREALRIIDAVENEVARHPAELAMAKSSDDIVAAKKDGKIAILMGVEGGHMIDSSLVLLRTLHRLGGRYMTLTHGKHLPWAGSSGDTSSDDPGLTDFGREVVTEMNRLGMMVDVSHISDKTFWGVIEASQAPLIASHSSCRALASHTRNITDDMIKAVAGGGGVVHINYYNAFLDDDYRTASNADSEFDAEQDAVREKFPSGSKERAEALRDIYLRKLDTVGRIPLDRLLDHFEHAAGLVGVDHVGLGSDFDGVSEETPQDMEDISKLPNLAAGLGRRGFSQPDIAKMMGGNTMRVFRAVEAASG